MKTEAQRSGKWSGAPKLATQTHKDKKKRGPGHLWFRTPSPSMSYTTPSTPLSFSFTAVYCRTRLRYFPEAMCCVLKLQTHLTRKMKTGFEPDRLT